MPDTIDGQLVVGFNPVILQGPQGVPGPAGPQGVQGQTGPSGAVGAAGVHGLKAKHFRRTRGKAGLVKRALGQLKIAVLGDSITAFASSTGAEIDGWLIQFVNGLAANGYLRAGSGVIPPWHNNDGSGAGGWYWTFPTPAGWTQVRSTCSVKNSTNTTAHRFAPPNTGVTVNVYYPNTSGPFTVSIDGGAAVQVNPTGASTGAVYTVNGLADTTHTVDIVRVSGTVQIDAAEVLENANTGTRIYPAAVSGALATELADQAFDAPLAFVINRFAADVCIIFMETNDAASKTPGGTYSAEIQTAITALQAAGIEVLLVAAPPASGVDFTAYTAVLYQLAASNDVPLLDLQELFGSYAEMNAYGLMADIFHPNAAGCAAITKAIGNILDLPTQAQNQPVTCGARSTGSLTLTGSAQDVPGASASFVAPALGWLHVDADFDFLVNTVGNYATGTLVVDGVTQTGWAFFEPAAGSGSRASVGRSWRVPLAAGAHTIKLQGSLLVGTPGSDIAQSPDTGFNAVFYPLT